MATQSASAEVADVIYRRMQNGAALVARSLSPAHLKDVAGTADFTQMLLAILRNTPAVDPEELRVAEQLARTAAFKRDLVSQAGGALTAEQVRALLGYRSVQAVHKAVTSHRLLVVDDNGRKLFPAFQFDGGSIAPGMAAVLAATPTTSPWALLQFMVEGDEGLGEDLPMTMVTGGPDTIQRLVRFAATLED
ncbi:hypothetical protein [Sphingomonas sp. Leaf4]|uniref:hypothetical protein n=1 Tax=Sphingomonas sp. Leaf4 TaxID=2876553 RepID=UPI001E5A5DB3|nr:hypothetical protein [Sphingomonas sp. Leaf4]